MDPTAENSSIQSDETQVGSSQVQPTASATRFQYEVKHGFFQWSIENFSSFPEVDDKYSLSPTFVLTETSWRLALHPKAKICGQDKISLSLIRHKSDLGPQNVTVSYRLGLESGENKIWFRPEESVVFGKGDCYGFQTSILGHLEDFLDIANNDDTLSVLCELYAVYKLNISISSWSSRNLNMDSDLSLNLLNLLDTEKRYDVLIEIPKSHARAHKCVLSARSKTLARLFEDGKAFIQLSCTRSCLYCVLYYMYSGSFIFLVKNAVFSIGLYELACELSLLELRDFLTPHKIELKSRIIVDEYKIECSLHEFDITDISTGKMESRDYSDSETGISVKICVLQTPSLEHMEFHIKVSGIAEALHFSFQLFILNQHCEPAEVIPAMLFPSSATVFQNSTFTYPVYFSVSDILKCNSSDGNIHLFFACKRYSLKYISVISSKDYKDLPIPCNDFSSWFLSLCKDLTTLFTTGYLSDVTLIASERIFKAHIPILGARSPYFDKLFNRYQVKNISMEITDPDPFSLELVLSYIYSGEINYKPDVTNYDILDLYKSSEWLRINSLKRKCSKYLARNLDRYSVFEILSSAEKYKNSYLISACNNYINRNQLLNSSTTSSSSLPSSSSPELEEESGKGPSSEESDDSSVSSSWEESKEGESKKELSSSKSQ